MTFSLQPHSFCACTYSKFIIAYVHILTKLHIHYTECFRNTLYRMFLKYIIKNVSEIRDTNLGMCPINKEDIFPREHGCLET